MPIKKFVQTEIPFMCLAFSSLIGARINPARYDASVLLTLLSLAGVVLFVVSQVYLWNKITQAQDKANAFDHWQAQTGL